MEEKICPLFMAGVLAGTFTTASRMLLEGAVLCQKNKCEWWFEDVCAVKFLTGLTHLKNLPDISRSLMEISDILLKR